MLALRLQPLLSETPVIKLRLQFPFIVGIVSVLCLLFGYVVLFRGRNCINPGLAVTTGRLVWVNEEIFVSLGNNQTRNSMDDIIIKGWQSIKSFGHWEKVDQTCHASIMNSKWNAPYAKCPLWIWQLKLYELISTLMSQFWNITF